MDTGRIIGGVVIIVVAAVLLYYLYDYLFNIGSIQKKGEIVTAPISSNADVVDYPQGGDVKLNQVIFTGGEMSVSFWIYVTGTQANSTYKKHILHLGTDPTGASGNVLAIMLGPAQQNGLLVKVAEGNDFNLQAFAAENVNLTESCNVSNMEFGRWVNVVVVLNNNVCDVYVDGKLSRSCVLKSQFLVPSATTPALKFYVLKKSLGTGTDTTWSGSLSGLNFYNYAISPDEAYRIYFAGPSGASGDLWGAIKSFFGAGQKAAAVFTNPA
jgi:hypothetical protein